MFKFFSDSKHELEHVVWPTGAETKKYMFYTIGVIVIMATLLAAAGFGMQSSLSALRTTLGMGKQVTSTVSGEDLATQADLQNILGNISVSGEGSDKVTVTPVTK